MKEYKVWYSTKTAAQWNGEEPYDNILDGCELVEAENEEESIDCVITHLCEELVNVGWSCGETDYATYMTILNEFDELVSAFDCFTVDKNY